MNRRRAMAAMGVAAFFPALALGQKPVARVGFIHSAAAEPNRHLVAAFLAGLAELGFVEGQNLKVDYRWANGRYEQLPLLVNELIALGIDLIAAPSLPAALAAKEATTSLPIVFNMGADPVAMGLVASLARPGGNMTGISSFFGALGGKRLELLRDLVPNAAVIAVLVNSANPNAATHLDGITTAATALGQKIIVQKAEGAAAINTAFEVFAAQGAAALLVSDDPLFTSLRVQIIDLAAKYRLPAIYYFRDFVNDGGLASYGSSGTDIYRMTGVYAGRILKGAKPADLPILQPTIFEFVINLKTAKALGLVIPAAILARVDEIIE